MPSDLKTELKRYCVVYARKESFHNWKFHCWAEDETHALEQFKDAEPKGTLVRITEVEGIS